MTRKDLLARTGISGIRVVSETTRVIEFRNGNCRPATDAEVMLVAIILENG